MWINNTRSTTVSLYTHVCVIKSMGHGSYIMGHGSAFVWVMGHCL